MSDQDDRVYIEQSGDTLHIMNAQQKGERDVMKVAVGVTLVGIVVILINLGFSPVAFFAILAWGAFCFFLRNIIAILVGLAMLGLVGYGIIWLFFL